MKRILAATVLSMMIIPACVTPEEPMENFVGQPSSQLTAKLGQPIERKPVLGKQGDEIWYYRTRQGWGRFEQGNRTLGVDTTWRMFYVNRDGIVYRYKSYQQQQ